VKEKDFTQGSFLGGLLKGLGELAQLAEKLETEGKTEIRRTGHFGSFERGVPVGSYGLNIRMGNLKPGEHHFKDKTHVQKNEPLLDIFDEGDFIQVVVELPEVSGGEEIEVNLARQTLLLTAQTPAGVFQKSIFLPIAVKSESLQKIFKNGILKIVLEKEL